METMVIDEKYFHMGLNGSFYNPIKRKGPYYAFVQALGELGVNEFHSIKAITEKMKEIMLKIEDVTFFKVKAGNAWEVFTKRTHDVLNDNRTDDARIRAKIIMNAATLQRMGGKTPYAVALKKCLQCIDAKMEHQIVPHYRLNNQFSSMDEVKPLTFRYFKKQKSV